MAEAPAITNVPQLTGALGMETLVTVLLVVVSLVFLAIAIDATR